MLIDYVKPTRTLRGFVELDMRVVSKLGTDLHEVIIKSVAATQKVLMTQLPDRLVLSQPQFDSLVGYTDEMYQSTDRLFQTPFNVMEVEVRTDTDHATTLNDDIKRLDDDLSLKEGKDHEDPLEEADAPEHPAG